MEDKTEQMSEVDVLTPALLLSQRKPLPRDGVIEFLADRHVYLYGGKPARKSVTKLVAQYFPSFDAEGIIDQNFAAWRSKKTSKYWSLITYLQKVQLRSDDYIKRAIAALWNANGRDAANEGTKMHADFEAIVNGLPPPQGETVEVGMFRKWLAQFCAQFDVEPFRSEYIVYYLHQGKILVAGQIDLILRGKTDGSFWCVDYKRKDPSAGESSSGDTTKRDSAEPEVHLLGQPTSKTSPFTKYGFGPFVDICDNAYFRYCCQQNIYATIAAEQHNIDFRDHMFLLQIHPQMDSPHTVAVDRIDDRMNLLFSLEMEAMQTESF